MKKLLIVLPLLILIMSCGKDNKDKGKVFIRVQNTAGFTLQNANIATLSYGDVADGSTTLYKAMPVNIYSAYCNYTHNSTELSAGYRVCGSPPPPPFEPGYYTFLIEPPVAGFIGITVTRQ
jgi:hypothetical protein